MSTRIATGVASGARLEDFGAAASSAARGLGGAPADLAVVFARARGAREAEDGLAAVRRELDATALVGCGAQGVVGDGREIEDGGVVVWAASFPEGRAETFHLEAHPAGPDDLTISGLPPLDDARAVILLVDPYTFPVEPLLARIGAEHPGLPVIGGLSSVGGAPGRGVLMRDGQVPRSGAVGVGLFGVDVRPCVSQGARPIGPEMVITAADGSLVRELASRPALERLKAAIEELDPHEQVLAMQGLLLGIVVDENQPDYDRGDFLIRGLMGVDEASGTITVGERVRVGQTVRLQVRDGASADEDLVAALGRHLDSPPAGALLFTCNGRGEQMFGGPHHDAAALERAFGGAPAGGFFCAGEIGPIGQRNFVHGFTATIAVFGR